MWRTDGWDNLPITGLYHRGVVRRIIKLKELDSEEREIIELGASMMLEALKKKGIHFRKGQWTDDATFETVVPGTVVFIPDEATEWK